MKSFFRVSKVIKSIFNTCQIIYSVWYAFRIAFIGSVGLNVKILHSRLNNIEKRKIIENLYIVWNRNNALNTMIEISFEALKWLFLDQKIGCNITRVKILSYSNSRKRNWSKNWYRIKIYPKIQKLAIFGIYEESMVGSVSF